MSFEGPFQQKLFCNSIIHCFCKLKPFLTFGVGISTKSQVVLLVPVLKSRAGLDLDPVSIRLWCKELSSPPTCPLPDPLVVRTIEAVTVQHVLYEYCWPTLQLVISSSKQKVASHCCHGDIPPSEWLRHHIRESETSQSHTGAALKCMLYLEQASRGILMNI